MNKPRTIYLDDQTFENLTKLAEQKKVTKSAIARIIINELHDDFSEFGVIAHRATSTH